MSYLWDSVAAGQAMWRGIVLSLKCAHPHLVFVPLLNLSDPTEIPPLSRDRCSNTPVALCFLWYRRLSLLYPHFSPYKWPIAIQRQDLEGGFAEKACL